MSTPSGHYKGPQGRRTEADSRWYGAYAWPCHFCEGSLHDPMAMALAGAGVLSAALGLNGYNAPPP